MKVDFNWAGVQGQAKYPYLVLKDIRWPEGVEALTIIEYDHDWETVSASLNDLIMSECLAVLLARSDCRYHCAVFEVALSL